MTPTNATTLTPPALSGAPRPVLAYIGLGLMGGPMSRHLVSQGWTVRGHDIATTRMNEAAGHGVQVFTSAAEAAKGADLVLLNLPTTDAVEQVMFGPQGVARVMQPTQRVVDFSTNEVDGPLLSWFLPLAGIWPHSADKEAAAKESLKKALAAIDFIRQAR